jgi:hypothetical protein
MNNHSRWRTAGDDARPNVQKLGIPLDKPQLEERLRV